MTKVDNGSLCAENYTLLYSKTIPEGEIAPDTYLVLRSHEQTGTPWDNNDVLGEVKFQCGPIKEAGVNGVCNEDLINMVVDRLKHFQNSQFKCEENEQALRHFQEGLMWLRKRTADRELRGVEGTSQI